MFSRFENNKKFHGKTRYQVLTASLFTLYLAGSPASGAELAGEYGNGFVFRFTGQADNYSGKIIDWATGREYRLEDIDVRDDEVSFFVVHEAWWDEEVVQNRGEAFRNITTGTIMEQGLQLSGDREDPEMAPRPFSAFFERHPASTGRDGPAQLQPVTITGPDGKGMFTGAGVPDDLVPVVAAANGEVPEGIDPLSVDIFTSQDFYLDRALWSDPRYFRCNAPQALQTQWGATEVPMISNNDPATAAWGYCDRDYPRSEIISPYGFASAVEHYEALQEEARSKGGPTLHTRETLPDWNGKYSRDRTKTSSWYYGAVLQIPTYLSLLTDEYQLRFVQQMYHDAATNAPQWPGSYCQPEGIMRRFAQYAAGEPQLIVTPELVQILSTSSQNLMTSIYMGREFDQTGLVPRLGPDFPQWYGESVGFWDGDVLITWTSNIQPWVAHGAHENSKLLQTIEIYSPQFDEDGVQIGIAHEAILYDPEAFVEPLRITQHWSKRSALNEGSPYPYIYCVQQNYPVDGFTTALPPGVSFEYTVPDIYGRPWAQIWKKFHEQNMSSPQPTGRFGL